MIRAVLSAALLAGLLAACGQASQPEAPPDQASDLPATKPSAPPASAPSPDLSPGETTPEADRTETGARNVLLAFACGIELRAFDQAWALMSPADKARWPRTEFAALFADLDAITVAVPTGTMESAAGSSYYTAPLTITATDADGRPVRYEGQVVLRRENDVPGATPAQLRWHIESVTLDWTH